MNKQTIEVLKDFVRAMKEANCYPKRIEALSQAIQWGEALQSAEGELPEKRKIEYLPPPEFLNSDNDSLMKYFENIGYNKALDLCKPILARKDLRIEALRKIRNHHFAKYEEQRYKTKKSEQELATLKKKLTESKKSL